MIIKVQLSPQQLFFLEEWLNSTSNKDPGSRSIVKVLKVSGATEPSKTEDEVGAHGTIMCPITVELDIKSEMFCRSVPDELSVMVRLSTMVELFRFMGVFEDDLLKDDTDDEDSFGDHIDGDVDDDTYA